MSPPANIAPPRDYSEASKAVRIEDVLVYRFGQIGDTVAALPSLWLLREAFPSAGFTLLSEIPRKGTHLPPEQVLPANGLVQSFWKYRAGSSGEALLSVARVVFALRLKRVGAVAYLAPTIRSPKQRQRDAFFFRLAGIRHSLGFRGFPDDPLPRLPGGRLAPVEAEADALLHRLALSGLPAVPAGAGRMDMLVTSAEDERAATWWKMQKGPERAQRGWFAVCHGSKWTSKQWPVERYTEVVRRVMNETGLLPVIMGGPEDRESGEAMLKAWQDGMCAAGELSVRESAALLRNAEFYLGNDTGTMHLAAAMGVPCVAIFSALDWPGRWSPYGRGHRVFRVEVPCAGCLLDVCNQHNECLTCTSVDEVLAACLEVRKSGRFVQ